MGFASKEEIASLPKLALTPRRYRPLESRRHLSLSVSFIRVEIVINDLRLNAATFFLDTALISLHSENRGANVISIFPLRLRPFSSHRKRTQHSTVQYAD